MGSPSLQGALPHSVRAAEMRVVHVRAARERAARTVARWLLSGGGRRERKRCVVTDVRLPPGGLRVVMSGFREVALVPMWSSAVALLAAAAHGVHSTHLYGRRAAIRMGGGSAAALWLPMQHAVARTPGSQDPNEAIEQIVDASIALKALRRDWTSYAVIDAEGRAGNIDAARKVLGGVAPQRGEAAIAVAKATPLYRVDGAFAAIRQAALNADDSTWAARLDVEEFVELGERIFFDLQKADNDFYGVVFASKGTTQLSKIYDEAKSCVDRSIDNFDRMLVLLKDANAPGL